MGGPPPPGTKWPVLVKNSEDEITNLGAPQTFCHQNQFSVQVDHHNIYFLEHFTGLKSQVS